MHAYLKYFLLPSAVLWTECIVIADYKVTNSVYSCKKSVAIYKLLWSLFYKEWCVIMYNQQGMKMEMSQLLNISYVHKMLKP